MAVMVVLCGCRPAAPKPGPPPLKISFRPSQFKDQGLVAGINNPSSSESIKVVAVFVRSAEDKDERSYRLDRVIRPLDSINVGWLELDSWKLKPGDKLRFLCEGYEASLDTEVP
jgi:hypothetical protein